MRKNTKFSVIIILIGLTLLIFGTIWKPYILPKFTPDQEEDRDLSLFFGDDMDILEGRISLPSIAWESMDREIDINEFRPEDLDPVWKNIVVRSDGIYDANTNEFIMESDESFLEQEGETFPSGGVEKKDYLIFNEYLDRNVTANFIGASNILGKRGFQYTLGIDKEEISGLDMMNSFLPDDQGGGSSSENGFASFMSESTTQLFYSDSSMFTLDPRTSIPLDIEIDIGLDLKLPDTTLLTVREVDLRYAEEDIWVESSSRPGTREKIEVITEIKTLGNIDPLDDNIAIYDRLTIHYDKKTGERISEGEYDEKETFTVDRATYQYKTGYLGTVRSGYFEFPIGNIEERTYPMWDEFSEIEGAANYIGRENRSGLNALVFSMISEDVEVDSGNAILPIYPHPSTTYLLDTDQKWYIDERTGFMLDFHIDGTVKVASSGPFGIFETEVTTFEVSLPENTTSLLLEIANLFHNLVIPLSNKEVSAFGLQISFTDDASMEFVDLADTVGRILDITEIWVPTGLILTGVLLVLVVIFLSIMVRRVKKRSIQEPIQALEIE